MDEKKKCKDLVRNEFRKEIRRLKHLWTTYCRDPEKYDEQEEAKLDEYGLWFDYHEPDENHKEGYFCYLISTGGPSDEFRFFVNLDFSLYKVEYWYMDWFDGAKVEAQGKDFEFLDEFWDGYLREWADQKMKEATERR